MKTETKTMSRLCGFCETGSHRHCPGAVTNGDGSLLVCPCEQPGCGQDKHYCKTCGRRGEGEVLDWSCIDRDACQSRKQSNIEAGALRLGLRLGQALLQAPGDSEAPAPTVRAPRSQKAPSAVRECTCGCGGQTKGGKFLPGHDSRYLSDLVAEPGGRTRELAYAVSEAFGKKYDKRTSG